MTIIKRICLKILSIIYPHSQIRKRLIAYLKYPNNKIYVIKNGIKKELSLFAPIAGLSIRFKGDNNTVEIEYPITFSHFKVIIKGNQNTFKIGQSSYPFTGEIILGNSSEISIGKNCEIMTGGFYAVANGGKTKLQIGNGVHIAKDVIIRTSDGQPLVDKQGRILNPSKDVIISDNVWIATRSVILKNTFLASGTVVAACALVNKKFSKPNTLIAGIPAKVIKENVKWLQTPISELVLQEQEEIKYLKQFRKRKSC